MTPRKVMLVAGEASGDLLGAELVRSLRGRAEAKGMALEFFGAGGHRMKDAGVELHVDMTAHAVIGLVEVVKKYGDFRRLFRELVELAVARKPDLVVCIDFSGFNRRFIHEIRQRARGTSWNPKIAQYVSPQVWASRSGRAAKLAADIDLLLTIFPFESGWYQQRVPTLKTIYVGHPVVDRYATLPKSTRERTGATTQVFFLPGSRRGELTRHLPVILDAAMRIREALAGAEFQMVLPDEQLVQQARAIGCPDWIALKIGDLSAALQSTDLAIASTGTVTMECAYFRVPTIAIYKTSWGTYQIGKRIVQVKYLAMPNLLANEAILPELIQDAATGENIASRAIELLRSPKNRRAMSERLGSVIDALGPPGASERAAEALLALV